MLHNSSKKLNKVSGRDTNAKQYKKSKVTQHCKTKHKYRKHETPVQKILEPTCFSCPHCDEYFSQEQLLRRHIKLHGNNFKSKFANNEILKEDSEQQRVDHKSDSDDDKYEYGEHFIYRPYKKLSHFEPDLSVRLNNREKEEESAEMFSCKECGKTFSGFKSLISHKLIHERKKHFKCPTCDQSFSTDAECEKHRDEVHFMSWKCDLCNSFFAKETELETHLEGCKKKTSDVLTCYLCSKIFKLKINLKSHIESGCGFNPQYSCKICGKAFVTRGILVTHEQIHTGKKCFLCRFCGKSFQVKAAVLRHELSHTGEKPFVCQIKGCGKAFNHRESLITHNTTHTGVRPYMCEKCGSTFSCIGNFIKHKKTHLKDIKNIKEGRSSASDKLKENSQLALKKNNGEKTILYQDCHSVSQTSDSTNIHVLSESAANNNSNPQCLAKVLGEKISGNRELNHSNWLPQSNESQSAYTNCSESLKNQKIEVLPVNHYEGATVPGGGEGIYSVYNTETVPVSCTTYCPQNPVWNSSVPENSQMTQNCIAENINQVTRNCEEDLCFTRTKISFNNSPIRRELNLNDNNAADVQSNASTSTFSSSSSQVIQNNNEKVLHTSNSKDSFKETSSANINSDYDVIQKYLDYSSNINNNRNATEFTENSNSHMINNCHFTDNLVKNSEPSLSSSRNCVGKKKSSTSNHNMNSSSHVNSRHETVLNHISVGCDQSHLHTGLQIKKIDNDSVLINDVSSAINENVSVNKTNNMRDVDESVSDNDKISTVNEILSTTENINDINEDLDPIDIKAEVKIEESDFIENYNLSEPNIDTNSSSNIENDGIVEQNDSFLYSRYNENESDNNYQQRDIYEPLNKCSQKLVQEKLSKHFSCLSCHKNFSSVYSLNSHKKVHKRKVYKCSFCDKSYFSKSCLSKHESIHNSAKHELVDDTPAQIFECKHCKKTFSKKWQCEKHKLVEHRTNEFTCPICRNTFSSAKNMTLHMNTHTGNIIKAYNCHLCGKYFKQKGNLRVHLDSKCGTYPQYVCKICRKCFMSAGSLNTHTKIHVGHKTFLCRFCGKGFRLKIAMQRHELIHTGEKPYVCTECGKAFAHRESLVTHNTMHTGIRPYMCEECGSRFSCCGNLIKHRSVHKKKALTNENTEHRRK